MEITDEWRRSFKLHDFDVRARGGEHCGPLKRLFYLRRLVSIMVEPKAPAAARIMAANSLIDRGWGKAAQLVDVAGEIRQLVEVKLNVVAAAPARNIDATCEPVALEYKDNSNDQQTVNVLVEPDDAAESK